MIDPFMEKEFQISIENLIVEREGKPVGYVSGYDDYSYFTLKADADISIGDVLINECGARYRIYDLKIERSPDIIDTKSAYYKIDAAISQTSREEIAAIHEAVSVLKDIAASVKPPEKTKLQTVALTVSKFAWIAELVNSESVRRLLDQFL